LGAISRGYLVLTNEERENVNIAGILVTVLVAIIVFWLLSFVSTILAVVGAILVLLGGIPSGGFGMGGRFGGGARGPVR
jgi:hypothetical protein